MHQVVYRPRSNIMTSNNQVSSFINVRVMASLLCFDDVTDTVVSLTQALGT